MDRAPVTLPDAYPRAHWRALDGHIELAVAEAVAARQPRPRKVTAVIAAMIERLGDAAVDSGTARQVSAAGREWLLQRAARRFGHAGDWFEAPCDACGARIDLRLSIDDVPCTAPGPGYPVIEVQTSIGRRAFEAPNGGHEERVALHAGDDPRRAFVAVCGLCESAQFDADRFSEQDLEQIDAALEGASPDVADSVAAVCPECQAVMDVRIDPLAFAFPRADEILHEVHLIASAYHWSEESILNLSLPRRRSYADLIRADHADRYMPRRR